MSAYPYPTCGCPPDTELQLATKINNGLVSLFSLMSDGGFVGKLVNVWGCMCSQVKVLEATNNNISEFYDWWKDNGGGGSGTVTSVSVVTANGVSGTVATATTTPAITLTLGVITPTSVNGLVFAGGSSVTSAAGSALVLATGTSGTAATFASATNVLTLSQGALNFTGATTITGGAGNMTIVSGTGNSRTLILQSTTAGGVATTFLTGNADQSATFAGAVGMAGALTGVTSIASPTSITGGAGNMTILSGTGASRTLIFQTTTSGSAATTALTLGADQIGTFAAAVQATNLGLGTAPTGTTGQLTLKTATMSTAITFGNIGTNTYGAISFNNVLTDAGIQGIYARGTTDPNIYLHTPTSGNFNFSCVSTTKATIFSDGGMALADNPTTPGAQVMLATGGVTTGAPTTGTAAIWKTGINVTSGTSVLDATGYVQLDVGGVLVKLARVTNS